MEGKHQQISAVKKKTAINTEQIEQNKDSFRRHQRELSFSEKMQIAFSLVERDKTIRRAVLLPKKKRISK